MNLVPANNGYCPEGLRKVHLLAFASDLALEAKINVCNLVGNP